MRHHPCPKDICNLLYQFHYYWNHFFEKNVLINFSKAQLCLSLRKLLEFYFKFDAMSRSDFKMYYYPTIL